MYIISSGYVEVMHTMEDEPFIIEKLYRGSIINHRSFLLADELDSDGRCGSTVCAYVLQYSDLEAIRNRYQ
jgi:CRP-like cAMP-binding protein